MVCILMILVLLVPNFAGALNTDRFYQIGLIFLSVFFVVGWIGFFHILNRILGLRWGKKSIYDTSLKLIAIFLAISLIFNSGVVYEIFGDKPTSMSLHSTMDGPKFNEMEVTGAQWLTGVKNSSIYADTYRTILLAGFSNNNNTKLNSTIKINESSYIYLGTFNIVYNLYGVSVYGSNTLNYYNDNNFTSLRDKIYDNGGSQVFQ